MGAAMPHGPSRDGPSRIEPGSWRLSSEFARVTVALDVAGNGQRLRITDVGTGAEIHLDPLELASLARSRHEQLQPLLMPQEYLVETDEWALHPQ
jgi:hypothetical protein